MKRELEEAIQEDAAKSGYHIKELAERICKKLSNKLGQEYSTKTLAKLIDEYNWSSARI